MPLPYISIDNFRAFKEKTEFGFAPITILTGTNSSGKSSLVDALRILQNYTAEFTTPDNNDFWDKIISFKEDYFNYRIPGFKDLVNYNTGKDSISFEFKTRFVGMVEEVTLCLDFQNKDGVSGILKSLKYKNDKGAEFFSMEIKEDNVTHLEIDFGFLYQKFEEEIKKEIEYYDAIIDDNMIIKEHFGSCEIEVLVNEELPTYETELLDSENINKENSMYEFQLQLQFIKTIGDLLNFFDTNDHTKWELYENKHKELLSNPQSIQELQDINSGLDINGLFQFFDAHNISYSYYPINPDIYWTFNNKRRIFTGRKEDIRKVYFKAGRPISGKYIYKIKSYIPGRVPKLKEIHKELHNYYVNEFDKASVPSFKPILDCLYPYREDKDIKLKYDEDGNEYEEIKANFINGEPYYGIFNEGEIPERKECYFQGLNFNFSENDMAMSHLFYKRFILFNVRNSLKELKERPNFDFIPSIRNSPYRSYKKKKEGAKEWHFENILADFKDSIANKGKIENKEIEKFLNKNLKLFNIGREIKIERLPNIAEYSICIEKRGRDINLMDFGYGISQIMPILLKIALIANEGKTKSIIIEEPETNLHPALQSKLADMFVEANKTFGIHFIIETHSEYLIRKLQYLTMKAEIKPEDTQIYYFYHPDDIPDGEPQVKKINIYERGVLSDEFGTGFFDEADKIAMSIWSMNQSQKN